MGLRRRLALSSTAAIVLGLVIILTPTMLSSQVEYSGLKNGQSIGDSTSLSTPLPRESIEQSLSMPFMFEFDVNSSHGFERIYLLHGTFGTPVFAISKGDSATIVILISSLSNHTLQASLERIDGLPPGVKARLESESITLQPYEQKELELEISISPTASARVTPKPPWPIDAEFIQLVFKGDEYDVGTGFLLRII